MATCLIPVGTQYIPEVVRVVFVLGYTYAHLVG
jgi:hypothetical protein